MKTILVDDEQWGLKRFELECANLEDVEMLGFFRNAADALAFAKENRVDLALLDIQMPGMNGLDLSIKLRELYPDIIIVFVSAYEQSVIDALKTRKADYYLLKPYSVEDVQDVMERAKLLSARQRKRVQIHTFGNFEVYVDGELLKLGSPKAKELLAVLVDRAGESVTAEDAFEKMWEQLPYNHTEAGRYRRALQKLQKALENAGIENILSYSPRARAIKPDMVECDYFDMLAEKPQAVQNWNGYYMNQYSWAESQQGTLQRIKYKYFPDANVYE